MYRRDEFIKKLSNVNSGEFLKKEMIRLEEHVDNILQKSETILSIVNSNSSKSTITDNIELITGVSETYAVHTGITPHNDIKVINGKVVWSDDLIHENGNKSATSSPWSHISISDDGFNGIIKILLPPATNKNVAKMLADKYADTTIQGGNPVGGHWGEGNVDVTYDIIAKNMYMIFKLLPKPESTQPKIYEAEATSKLWCDSASQGITEPDVSITLIRWSYESQEDAQLKANKAALAEAQAKIVCGVDLVSYTLPEYFLSCNVYNPNTEGAGHSVYNITATGRTMYDAEQNAIKKAKAEATTYLQTSGVCTLKSHEWTPMYDATTGCFSQMKCQAHTPTEYREPTYEEWNNIGSNYFQSTSPTGRTCYIKYVDNTPPTVSIKNSSASIVSDTVVRVTWYLEYDKVFTNTNTQIVASVSDDASPKIVSAGTGKTRIITTFHERVEYLNTVFLELDSTKPEYLAHETNYYMSQDIPPKYFREGMIESSQ
jgi:hypothetical protein